MTIGHGTSRGRHCTRKSFNLPSSPHDYCTMPPRGSEGLNFGPILTHYLFLFTSILSVVRIPFPAPFLPDAR